MGTPILMYHSVRDDPPPETAGLAVSPAVFADQMAVLADNGFTPVRLGTVDLPAKPICITFDDGYADFHTHALPVLEAHGFPATVFVTTGWLDDAGPDAAGRPLDRMLTWAHVREVAAHGIDVAAHSHSHPQLDQLRDGPLHDELTRSRLLLEDRLGTAVPTMAYPYGYSSARVRRAVRIAGYGSAFAVGNRTSQDGDRFAIPRLTVQRTTSLTTFAKITEGEHPFLRERTLTRGYAVVRRSRRAYRRVMHRG
ncbi:MAG: polysaccharide deacetylase family protein [Streptosporangiaceae bacterium]